MTRDQAFKREWLTRHSFLIDNRDPRLNTAFKGKFMVVQTPYEDWELPTESGCNGPWCVVGDDMNELVDTAFSAFYEGGE